MNVLNMPNFYYIFSLLHSTFFINKKFLLWQYLLENNVLYIENQKLSLKNVLTLNMRLHNGIYSAGNLKRTMLNKGKGEKRTIKMWTLEFGLGSFCMYL